ncbi:MAG: hypothetical protein WC966_05730 [Bradymonadales bacterium]
MMRAVKYRLWLILLLGLGLASLTGCPDYEDIYDQWLDQNKPKPKDPIEKPDPNDDIDIIVKPKPGEKTEIVPKRPDNALSLNLNQNVWVFDTQNLLWYFENKNSYAKTEPVFELRHLIVNYDPSIQQSNLALWSIGEMPEWRLESKEGNENRVSIRVVDNRDPQGRGLTLDFERDLHRASIKLKISPTKDEFHRLSIAWEDSGKTAIYLAGNDKDSARARKIRLHHDNDGPYTQDSRIFSTNILAHNSYAISLQTIAPTFLDLGATQAKLLRASIEATGVELTIYPKANTEYNSSILASLNAPPQSKLAWTRPLWQIPEDYNTSQIMELLQNLCEDGFCPEQILLRGAFDQELAPLTLKEEYAELKDTLNEYGIGLWLVASPYVPLSQINTDNAELYLGGTKAQDLQIIIDGVLSTLWDARSKKALDLFKQNAELLMEEWPQVRAILMGRSDDLNLAKLARLNIAQADYAYYRKQHNHLLSPIYKTLSTTLSDNVILGAQSAGNGDEKTLSFVYFSDSADSLEGIHRIFQRQLNYIASNYRAAIADAPALKDLEQNLNLLKLQALSPVMLIPQIMLKNWKEYKEELAPILAFRRSIQPIIDELSRRCCSPILLPNSTSTDPEYPAFTIGQKLLAYPIFANKTKTLNLHIPAGDWVELRSGKRVSGPSEFSYATHDNLPLVFGANYQILPMNLPRINPMRTHYVAVLGKPNGTTYFGLESHLSTQYDGNAQQVRFALNHSDAKFVYFDFFNTNPQVICNDVALENDDTLAWVEAPDDAKAALRRLPNRVMLRMPSNELQNCYFLF